MNKKTLIQKIILKIEKKLNTIITKQKYEVFSILIMFLIILIYLNPIYKNGHIVFSDLDFPQNSKYYLDEIVGLWNSRWSTATLFNIPRLIYILPLYLIASIFGFNGEILIKSFITTLILLSSLSMYIFSENIIAIYFREKFDFYRIFIVITAGLFYSLNPWVIFRIQHIYLLCGYSFFPLVINYFLYIFHPKFINYRTPFYYPFKNKINKRNVKDIALLCFLISISSGAIHYFFYIFFYLGIIFGLIITKYTVVYFFKYGIKKVYLFYKINLKKIFISGIFFGIFNMYWLSIYLGNIVLNLGVSQHNINVVDTLVMFSKNSSLKKVIYLISYWWPMFNINELPISFYLGGGIILFFVFLGVTFRFFKNNIVIWFGMTSLIFIIFSTGVELKYFASIFIKITKIPVFGNIFRDPNKTIGILALNYSVLLIFGLEHIYNYIPDNIKGKIIKISLMTLVILGFTLYIQPIREQFIEGFYSPVEIPKEYALLNEKIEKKDKTIYMPISDNMTQSIEGVSTPYWNKNPYKKGRSKSTADFHIYNSNSDTVFHHEGNSPSITYYLNYLQHILDNGLSTELKYYLSAFGANKFVYHNEYLGQKDRQDFNEKILDLQKGMAVEYSNDIFRMENIGKRKSIVPIKKIVLTPFSYNNLAGYQNLGNFNFIDYGVLYSSLNFQDNMKLIEKGDYIEMADRTDFFLSNIDEKYFLSPFEYINDGNVFLKWSKTFLKNSDWQWFMRINGIENYTFEQGFSKGVAVTFASAGLTVPAYKKDEIKGKVIVDFNSILKLDKFFDADNPDVFEIYANPISPYSKLPVVLGEIAKDYPKKLWQVAKSDVLPIKEKTFYRFNLKVSGRGSNKLHFKVRFYNKNMQELGINYIVAPSEEINFNGIDFYGECISPKNTKYMRIDLLSYQRPAQKIFWWIHDLKVFEYEGITEPNLIKMEKEFDNDKEVEAYIRVFYSIKGGKIVFSLNGEKYEINTKSDNRNYLKWIKISDLFVKKGKNIVTIDNITGFNAVNLIAFIPKDEKIQLVNKMNWLIDKTKQFFVLEAEETMEYQGNIQSQRTYPDMFNGKGISLKDGTLKRKFFVGKDDNYSLLMNLRSNLIKSGQIKLKIINDNSQEIYIKDISIENIKKESIKNVVIDTNYDNEFIKEYKEIEDQIKYKNKIELNNIFLKKGIYELNIKIESNVSELSSLNKITKFDPKRIIVKNTSVKENNAEDGCPCIKIKDDMYSYFVEKGVFKAYFDKTCSSDWYEYATNTILVEEENEYLFNVDMISKGGRKRHIKIEMLDKDNISIKTLQIPDVPESKKTNWNRYEEIIEIPKNVKKVIIKFSIKGNEESDGIMTVKNFNFIKYTDMITLDNLIFFEGNSSKTFFNTTKEGNKINDIEKKDKMTFKFNFKSFPNGREKKLINFYESFHPIWQIKNIKEKRPYILNGLTNGYLLEGEGTYIISTALKKVYIFGVFVLFMGIIFLIYIFRK